MPYLKTSFTEPRSGDTMAEYVILVNSEDVPIGLEEKVRCHMPDGRLHRAFTALLFDDSGRLALARRSPEKMLWPGYWDGTFASHPREGETYVSSSQRRMPEEMGCTCDMDYLFKFEYHAGYRDVGSENEICAVLMGIVRTSEVEIVPDEITQVRWLGSDELASEASNAPETFCPWMLLALHLLDRSDAAMLQRHSDILRRWTSSGIKNTMKSASDAHLAESQWRLIQ